MYIVSPANTGCESQVCEYQVCESQVEYSQLTIPFLSVNGLAGETFVRAHGITGRPFADM